MMPEIRFFQKKTKGDYTLKRVIALHWVIYFFWVSIKTFYTLMDYPSGAFEDFQNLFRLDATHIYNRPWTLLTYIFTVEYDGFFKMLLHMLLLYFSGMCVMRDMKRRHLLYIYLLGAILPGLCLTFLKKLPFFVGREAFAFGPLSVIYAWFFASVAYAPNQRWYVLFFPIKGKHLGFLMVMVALLSLGAGKQGGWDTNASSLIALLGALVGGGYALAFKKFAGGNQQETSIRFVSRKKNVGSPKCGASQRSFTNIEDLLKKIEKTGYKSLTKEEKKRLFEEYRE